MKKKTTKKKTGKPGRPKKLKPGRPPVTTVKLSTHDIDLLVDLIGNASGYEKVRLKLIEARKAA